jgi:hypothetical protein
LNCTGTNAAQRSLIVPTVNKNYIVENNTTGGFAILVTTSGGTGIVVPNGFKAALYVDGTNVVTAFNWLSALTTTTATIGTLTLTNALTTANGGTGLSSYTAGDLPYYTSGTALSKLGIGASGYVLTSSGSAPQWTQLSTIGVTTFSGGTTGLTPASATSGAITLAGTLVVGNGGTGLTSLTAGYIPFGNGTSAFGSSANLFWDNTNAALGVGVTNPNTYGKLAVSGGNMSVLAGGILRAYRSDNATYNEIKYVTSGDLFYLNQANGGSFSFNISGTEYAKITTGGINLPTAASGNANISFNGSSFSLVSNSSSAPIIFSTNSAEAMRLTTAGYLGIGTNSPSQYLDIAASGANMRLYNVGGSGTKLLLLDAGGNSAVGQTGGSLQFYSGGLSNLTATLAGDGNFLLGTSSNYPNAKLFVNGSINVNYSNQIAMRYNVSGQTNAYYKGMTGTQIGLSQTARGLALFNYDQDSNQGITFYPAAYPGMTSPPDPSMYLNSAGNLGLGYGPNSWESGSPVIQMNLSANGGTSGNAFAIWSRADTARFWTNAYFNGSTYVRLVAGIQPTNFSMSSDGSFQWQNVGTGAAGSTFTNGNINQTMVLSAAGTLSTPYGYNSSTLYSSSGSSGTSPTLTLNYRSMGFIQVFAIGAGTERMSMYYFTNCGPTSVYPNITLQSTLGFNITFTVTAVNSLGGFTVAWSGGSSVSISVNVVYLGINAG